MWVVVPAHDEAARLGDTLGALAAQTDRDFTLLVVDNGSTDGTGAVARQFAAQAPFPVEVIEEPEKGVGSRRGHRVPVRDRGAARRLLARTDADCLPRPGWVAAARAALAARRRGWSAGGSPPAATSTARSAGPASRALVALAALVRPAAAGRTARPGTWRPYRMHAGQQHGHHRRAVPGRAAGCPGAPRRPTGSSSTGSAGTPTAITHCRDDGRGELDPAAARVRRSPAPPAGTSTAAAARTDGRTRADARPNSTTRCARDADRPAVLAATRGGASRGARHPRRTGRAADGVRRRAARTWPARRGHRRRRRTARAARARGAARRVPARAARSPCSTPAPGPTCCGPGSRWPRPALVLADAAAQAVAGWARAAGPPGPAGAAGPGASWGRWPRSAAGCRAARRCWTARAAGRRRPADDGDGDAVIVFTSGTTTPAARRGAHPGRPGRRHAGGRRAGRGRRPGRAGARRHLLRAASRRWPAARRSPCRRARPGVLARQLRRLRAAGHLSDPAAAAGRARPRAPGSPAGCGRARRRPAPSCSAAVRRRGRGRGVGRLRADRAVPGRGGRVARRRPPSPATGDLVGAPLPGVRAARRRPTAQLLLAGPGRADRYLGEEPDPLGAHRRRGPAGRRGPDRARRPRART